MRRACLLATLACCRFEHGTPGSLTGDGGTDATGDGPGDVARDATRPPYCDPADDTLIACYAFESSTQDASPNALHATMTNVTFAAGRVGMAAQLGATSAMDVADSALFDSPALTIEAWIHPTQLPGAGARFGILDNNGQYGMFLHEQGRLHCAMVNGHSMMVDAAIAASTWTHVACTYSGSTTTIYVDGVQLFQASGGTALATGGTTGISIGADNPPGAGARFLGLIDQVRLSSVARTREVICADAPLACP